MVVTLFLRTQMMNNADSCAPDRSIDGLLPRISALSSADTDLLFGIGAAGGPT
jgi:hypothetical protein